MSEGAVQLNFVILAFCSPLRKSWNLFSKNKLTPNKQVTFIAEPHCNGGSWKLHYLMPQFGLGYVRGQLWTGLLWTGLFWTGLLWTWSVMNIHGVLWTLSVMSGFIYEPGLFRMVCYEWSVMNSSALNGHHTKYPTTGTKHPLKKMSWKHRCFARA